MQNIVEIGHLNKLKTFDEEQALDLLPLLITITSKSRQNLNVLNSQAEYFKGKAIKTNELQDKTNTLLSKWSEKVKRLGLIPIGTFKVRIPGMEEDDFYWEFPEFKVTKF
jgi:hypothetical protein